MTIRQRFEITYRFVNDAIQENTNDFSARIDRFERTLFGYAAQRPFLKLFAFAQVQEFVQRLVLRGTTWRLISKSAVAAMVVIVAVMMMTMIVETIVIIKGIR